MSVFARARSLARVALRACLFVLHLVWKLVYVCLVVVAAGIGPMFLPPPPPPRPRPPVVQLDKDDEDKDG